MADRISPEEVHTYSLETQESGFFEVTVEQRGIDLAVTLIDSSGRHLALVDDFTLGEKGAEALPALIEKAGGYRVEIKPANDYGPSGNYAVKLVIRQPSEQDRLRASAVQELTRAVALEKSDSLGEALACAGRALDAAERAQDRRLGAEALLRKGLLLYISHRYEQARDALRLAGARYQFLRNPLGQAHALNWEGSALFYLNDLQGALNNREKALEILQGVEGLARDLLQARLHRNIGVTHDTWGEYRSAENSYLRAIEIWPPGADEANRLRTSVDLGYLYSTLADQGQARHKFQEALGQVEPLELDEDLACQKARALGGLAQTYAQEDSNRALFHLQRAFGLSKRCRDVGVFAIFANQVGDIYLKRPNKGLNRCLARLAFQTGYEQSLGVNEFTAMNALTGLAGLDLREGNVERGRALFDQVLAARRKSGFQLGIVGALLGRAEAERALGDLSAAQRSIEESLAATEELRQAPEADTLSASLFASRRENYDLSVSIWMEQHQREPEAGFGAKAFEVNERARGRTLLDWLSGEQLTEEEDSLLTQEERDWNRELRSLWRRRMQLSGNTEQSRTEEGKRQIEALNGQIQDLLFKLETERSRRRVLDFEASEPLTLKEIQEQVLDEDTLLLSYWSGGKGEGIYLWAVDSGSITVHTISPAARKTVEKLVAVVKDHLSNRDSEPQDLLPALSNLSQILLSPVASQLRDRRLLIVADGPLQAIPFSVLQDPRSLRTSSGQSARRWTEHLPLVDHHTVVMLPSASMLGVLRRELADRPEPSKELAIFYDPVFRRDDDRVVRGEPQSMERSSVLDGEIHNLKRLDYTRVEAEAILSMVDPEQSYSATGFEANLDAAQSPELGQYRYLHFATHGIIDDQPELSRLALSAIHENGFPRNGFLRAYEISLLQLPVELVVLSACETGVGKAIPGEGVFNLSRAFFYAGARRVVVTYWKVDDEATAQFMTFFYQGLLEEDLAPSKALRKAQKEMRHTRWAHPYYWGGFVLQGEW